MENSALMFNKLAGELKTQRESLGLTLEQIASRIRIDIKFLKAMEKGDFAFLPELYIKAYLKEFASILELDKELILKKYAAAKEGKEYTPEALTPEPEVQPEPQRSFTDTERPAAPVHGFAPKPLKSNFYIYILLSFVGVAAIVYILVTGSEPEEIIRETPYEDILEENKNRYEESFPEEAGYDSLTLAFTASDSCWIKVVLDEAIPKEYFLHPKGELTIKAATSFNMVLGNYRSVKLTLNGNPLSIENQKTNVARITIDKEGVRPLVFD